MHASRVDIITSVHLLVMPLYAFRLSLSHPTFRIPHLLSIAQLFDFPIKFVSEDLYRSVLVVELRNREDADRILERGIVAMSVESPSTVSFNADSPTGQR